MKRERYNGLSIAAKQSFWRSRQAEPPIRCPKCEGSTPVRDLLRHLAERCTGYGEPHHLARWIAKEAALELASRDVLEHWQRRGLVRQRVGDDGELQLLERDVVQLVAWSRALGDAAGGGD